MTKCPFCSLYHEGACPRIKSFEYHPNGTIKSVEFHPLVASGVRPSDCCQYPDCPDDCRGRRSIENHALQQEPGAERH